MGWVITIFFILVLTTFYGAMAGFTIQVARRNGVAEGSDIALGLGWPIGLGIALAYGSSSNLAEDYKKKRRYREMGEDERRIEEFQVQQHRTRMAKLKAEEALALEKALHPTYEAIEAPPDKEGGYLKDEPTRYDDPLTINFKKRDNF